MLRGPVAGGEPCSPNLSVMKRESREKGGEAGEGGELCISQKGPRSGKTGVLFLSPVLSGCTQVIHSLWQPRPPGRDTQDAQHLAWPLSLWMTDEELVTRSGEMGKVGRGAFPTALPPRDVILCSRHPQGAPCTCSLAVCKQPLTLAAAVNRTRPQCPSPCLPPENARTGFVRADPGWSWGLIRGPRPLGKSKETVTSLRLMEKSEAVCTHWPLTASFRTPHT